MACLHRLFQQQAKRTPAAIAVVDGHRQLMYREPDQVTDALAGYLLAHGVQPDSSVGMLLDKIVDETKSLYPSQVGDFVLGWAPRLSKPGPALLHLIGRGEQRGGRL